MPNDTAFQMATSNIRFGLGTTREVGWDFVALGSRRVLVFIDPKVLDSATGAAVRESLKQANVDAVFNREIDIEPTDQSFQHATAVADEVQCDAILAVGGGSTIDTAKAANLYTTYPDEFLAYVNAPVGQGKPVPGPLKPLIAVPTTAGTGSETTGVAVFDLKSQHVKTGISHRHLKPTLGILDPENTRTMPRAVAAATGLDVLSHALESYTALPYDRRPKPNRPNERPTYQGANPLSDVWALYALETVAEFLQRAFADSTDDEARGKMMLAAAMAGVGFGNAGVHLPHAMAYPVSGMVRSYLPPGYDVSKPLVPHGMSVILHTPAVARFTADASPQRHLRAARALGAVTVDAENADAGNVLAERVIDFMKQLGMPNGLRTLGYIDADIPALVDGTAAQQRLTQLSPVTASRDDLAKLFRESMRIWN